MFSKLNRKKIKQTRTTQIVLPLHASVFNDTELDRSDQSDPSVNTDIDINVSAVSVLFILKIRKSIYSGNCVVFISKPEINKQDVALDIIKKQLIVSMDRRVSWTGQNR